MTPMRLAWLSLLLSQLLVAPPITSGQTAPRIADVVASAYRATHAGWSTDEVLLQDELNQAFLQHCRQQLPAAESEDLNWKLLNLRKAGKLQSIPVTRRKSQSHRDYRHLAEIAARLVQDQFKISIDRMMCVPRYRAAFDDHAQQIAKSVDPYRMRKAAFGLRKARQLRPELVLRVADWDREISTHRVADLTADGLLTLPESPGVYLFRDDSGYLYIGESGNLRQRIEQHLDASDRRSLARYFAYSSSEQAASLIVEIHAFPKESRARQVGIRRAYESELIASRKPKFNVRP